MSTSAAIAAAQATARRLTGATVTLARGNSTSEEITAGIGTTAYDLIDEQGVVHRIESRDFLIAVGDYDVGAGPVRPARGDRIVETNDLGAFTYEVSAPDGQNDWRWNGPFRDTYRVHTKKVGEEISG